MIRRNAFAQLTALAIILVTQTIYMIAAARLLGPEDFGRFSYLWALIQILLLGGDLGLHNTAIRKISGQISSSKVMSGTFLALKAYLSLVLLGIIWSLSFFLPETPEARLTLVFFGAGLALHSVDVAVNVLFQAHGKLYMGSLNLVILFTVQFVIGLFLMLNGVGLISVGIAYFVAACIALTCNFLFFCRIIYRPNLRLSSDWKSFARESLPVGLGTFFHNTSSRLGLTLLGILSIPVEAGMYGAASRICLSSGNVPIAIFSALLPAMAAHQEETEPVRRLFRKSLYWMILISIPLAVLIWSLARPFIVLIYGDEYMAAVSDLRILVWSLVPMFTGMAFSHVLLSQDRLVRRLPLVTGSAVLIHTVVLLILIPLKGSEGAAWGLIVNESVLMIGYVLAVWKYLGRDGEKPAGEL